MSPDTPNERTLYNEAESGLFKIIGRDDFGANLLREYLKRYEPPVLSERDHYKLRLMMGVLVVGRVKAGTD